MCHIWEIEKNCYYKTQRKDKIWHERACQSMVWFVNWFLQVNIGLSINCVYPKWKTLLATDLYQLRFHTLLQGAYKYMLCQFMDSRNTFGKKILAKYQHFCMWFFKSSMWQHMLSFVRRHFKAWMQMALFIVPCCLTNSETVLVPSL